MDKRSPKSKIESIENQIQKLKAEKLKIEKNLEKSKYAKILSIIKNQNGFSHDFDVVIGALSEAIKSLNGLDKNDERIKAYHKIGQSLLKPKKTNKSHSQQLSKTQEPEKNEA